MTPDDLLRAARLKGLEVESRGVDIAELEEKFFAASGYRADSEAAFQADVIRVAKSHGWRAAHFRKVRVRRGDSTHWETPVAADGKGFLDLELVRDRVVKVELKMPGRKMTPEQVAWSEAYTAAGVEWYLWYPKDMPTIREVLR